MTLRYDHFTLATKGLALPLAKQRLRIEGIHLAHAAVTEDRDHRLRFRGNCGGFASSGEEAESICETPMTQCRRLWPAASLGGIGIGCSLDECEFVQVKHHLRKIG